MDGARRQADRVAQDSLGRIFFRWGTNLNTHRLAGGIAF